MNSTTATIPAPDAFAAAREVQLFWKSSAVRLMTVAVCEMIVSVPRVEFSANDLKLADHGGRGIAGLVFNRLAEYGVIEPACVLADGKPMQKTVKNAGGNRIGVWRLKSGALAHALLRQHDALPPIPQETQPELGAAQPAATLNPQLSTN